MLDSALVRARPAVARLVERALEHGGAALTARCLAETDGDVDAWVGQRQTFVQDWRRIVEEVQHSASLDFSMFSMSVRKLNNLCRTL